MLSTYLVLLVIGAIAIGLGGRLKEEVYRLATITTGLIALIWGYSGSPSIVQLLFAGFFLSFSRFYRLPSKC
jgi:hypothetical protein